MANRDILKEAIADAKSIKEAAIANAKAALEEAFTPYLKEKFTAKLAEMEAEDMDEAKEEMDENYSKEEMEEMSNPVMRHGLEGDDTEEKRTEKMREEEETMDEMDLDELLAELDEELSEAKDEEAEETLNEQEEEAEEEESEEVEGEEEEEIDLEDMTEEELKDLIEDVIEDMVRAGELEAGENFEGEEDEEGEEEGEEEIDVDMEDEEETLAESQEVTEVFTDLMMNPSDAEILMGILGGAVGVPVAALAAAYAKDGINAVKNLVKGKKAGMEEAKDEMDEMKKEIEELATTLAETKLLNAKLLYTNKIFRAKNLTESQKVKVLESFDKASSVKQAKLIYETLTAVKETKVVNESVRGMASKAAGIAPEKKPILEVDNQFARWQVLAGIKK